MIDALIAGRIYGKAQPRTSKNGNPFATAKLRVPTRDGNAQFVNVICFSSTASTALMALGDGDAVALVGELSAKAYLNKDGEPAPSLDLLAHQVLTTYLVKQKREAVSGNGGRQESQRGSRVTPPAAAPADRDLDDDLDRAPF